MPLPQATNRQHIHTRAIEYSGYLRDDGNWDLEAHMTDIKTNSFTNKWRGEIQAGEPLHEMLLRLTIDNGFVIKEVVAVTDNSPFQMCPDITPNYQSLIGIRLGPGWRKAVRQKVGGTHGCTHLTELLFPMATVAFQTIMPFRSQNREKSTTESSKPSRRPPVLDTCHAWASDSPVVKENVPKFYTGE